LLQFIDIKIARYHHTWPGPAKIFGFVAARDTIEPLRNYVYRREINSSEDEYVKRNTVNLIMEYGNFICYMHFESLQVSVHAPF
jgi:hypothetical protein